MTATGLEPGWSRSSISRPARIGICIVVRKRGPAARTRASSMVIAPIFIGRLIGSARPALMIEDCESVALLTPDRFEELAQVRVKNGDLRVAKSGLARIQREQKDVLASVSQLDGVQLVECPDKQTGGDQDEKRDRDLGDHQNVLRTAARSVPAAIL